MRAPKVVAVNGFYWPDRSPTAQLLTDLAEHLAQHHMQVTIITSRLSYDDLASGVPAHETRNGVAIRRVWTTRFGRAGLWGRGLDLASFYFSATIALLIEVKRGDTILAKTDPPLISIVAAIVASFKGAHLVNWCQDLFPEIAASLGLRWAAGPLGWMLKNLRNRSLHAARWNVVLSDHMRQHLIAEFVPDEGIRVIHNWPDPAIRPLPRKRAAGQPFCICYSGNLGRAHNVAAVIDLIERTADITDLRWRFVGGGGGMSRLRQYIGAHDIANVTFEGYAPKAELAKSLALADAHLVTLDPTCEGLIQPSKIYGILAAGRPTIFIGSISGGIARILQRHGAGLALDIARPLSWRPALQALIDDPARVARHGTAAHAAYRGFYTSALAFAAWWAVLAPDWAAEPAMQPKLEPALAQPYRLASVDVAA